MRENIIEANSNGDKSTVPLGCTGYIYWFPQDMCIGLHRLYLLVSIGYDYSVAQAIFTGFHRICV